MTTTEDRKKIAAGHYYMVPNAVFVLELTPGELAVYNALLFREDRSTFECVVSYQKLAEDIHSSKNSVRKYVRGLEEKGLISTEHTFINRKSDGAKRNGCLRHHIHHIDHALELHHEQQLREAERAVEQARIQNQLDQLAKKKVG